MVWLADAISLAVGGFTGEVLVTPPDAFVVCETGDWIGLEWARISKPIPTASTTGIKKPRNTVGSKRFGIAVNGDLYAAIF
jgi:hypothetical protein